MFFVDRHVKFKTGRSLSKQISASDYNTFTSYKTFVSEIYAPIRYMRVETTIKPVSLSF